MEVFISSFLFYSGLSLDRLQIRTPRSLVILCGAMKIISEWRSHSLLWEQALRHQTLIFTNPSTFRSTLNRLLQLNLQRLFRKIIVANQRKNQLKKWRTTKYQIVKYNNIHANVWQFKSSMEWNAGIQNISKGQNSDKIGSFRHEFARHRGLI